MGAKVGARMGAGIGVDRDEIHAGERERRGRGLRKDASREGKAGSRSRGGRRGASREGENVGGRNEIFNPRRQIAITQRREAG